MDYIAPLDRLNYKINLDQNKLKDKRKELVKLNEELKSIEERCDGRKQLSSMIDEKIKLVDSFFIRVKNNFSVLEDKIDDLDSYRKQILSNKYKFEVPIEEFQKSLSNSLVYLNSEINNKVNYIKSKYKEINDKLEIKKENFERLTNESSAKYEQLKLNVSTENQNIIKLEDEIKNKQNLIKEINLKIDETEQLNKQLESKTQIIINENKEIDKEIMNMNLLFRKASEDNSSIESKIKMQDELIDCVKMVITELESNLNSDMNYKKYKEEYEQVEKEINKLDKEYEDRVKIFQIKSQCKELKEKKIEHINKIVNDLKAIDADEQLTHTEKDAKYEQLINEMQDEIKFLENELEGKGLLGQINLTQQPEATSSLNRNDQELVNDELNRSSDKNKFDQVPEELTKYLYDNDAILFNSPSQFNPENSSLDLEIMQEDDDLDMLEESIDKENNLSNFDLDQYTNPNMEDDLTNQIFESSSISQIVSGDVTSSTPKKIPVLSINKSIDHNRSNTSSFKSVSSQFKSPLSDDYSKLPIFNQFKTPSSPASISEDKKRKHQTNKDLDKSKRKRQN